MLSLLIGLPGFAQNTDDLPLEPLISNQPASNSNPNWDQLDGVAAVVNDGVVLQSELAEELRTIRERILASGTQLPPQDVLITQVLERLVVQEIQLQRAGRTGIQIPDEALNEALSSIAQRNSVSLLQLPEMLAQEGISYPVFRDQIRKQMIVDRLKQRDVLSRIDVSDREIANYLERESRENNSEYNISHLLISLPSGATSIEIGEAEDRITNLYEQLQSGAGFAEIAIANSDGQQALDGGNIGWRKSGELPTLFADVVPTMDPGDVSEPIRSGGGFHLIKLDDIRGQEKSFEDQSEIRHILIKTTEVKDGDTAQQQLIGIRQKIVDGEDFTTIATAVSEDPGSAANGGDLGWTASGIFVPEFQAMADSLQIGELSEPFGSPFGWHILEVTGRRTYDTTEELQKREAVMAIRNTKLEEETELWIRKIRDEAFVESRI